MLETKNLTKTYKPKKGVPVKALDNISLRFPEKGMIFLLGKSGSGKSTMLNVLGGLDRCDGGEIIIKGVSSRDFSQQRFDSYRNTYVGFIFQEYNVLEEFTVGANVALALELQGKKVSDVGINEILEKVDLDGYGQRRPNELSGGQKQRVAIARALVKDPEIIMADEPTGALDSATGRQIFDTLKKLSREKLVIVVSHDRDFAEQYADRIIELSDGRVISDVELSGSAEDDSDEAVRSGMELSDGEVIVPKGYHLTEEDREAINAYLENGENGGLKIKARAKKSRFADTDTSKIAPQDPSTFRLIKSRLPMKNAFRIGAGGLKHKKIRLVITVLLSCIAFTLFGLADTFGSYDHIKTCTDSIVDTGISYASVVKSYKMGSGVNTYWNDYNHRMSEKELSSITESFGTEMSGVYTPQFGDLSFSANTGSDYEYTKSSYNIYCFDFTGFAEINESVLSSLGYKLSAGDFPGSDKNEICVSDYVYETFRLGGYVSADGENTPVSSYSDLIGKTLTVNGTEYTITGIVDTDFDLSRYEPLTEEQTNLTKAQKLVNMALGEEFGYAAGYSLSGVAMVGRGTLEGLIAQESGAVAINRGSVYFGNESGTIFLDASHMIALDKVAKNDIIWTGGIVEDFGEKDLIVTSDMLLENDTTGKYSDLSDLSELAKSEISVRAYEYSSNNYIEEGGYRIVGVIDTSAKDYSGPRKTLVLKSGSSLISTYTDGEGGIYSYAVGDMPESRSEIKTLVEKCYTEDTGIRYQLQNSVTYELDSVHDILITLSGVFFYIGLGFAVFAGIMLANFIATSIAYKKQEIGILRAIGSRSNDVFRIFFSESFIIAATNFILSCIGTFAATEVINYFIRSRVGILITILGFGPRQIVLLLAVSVVIAALASFIPVKRIASKKPIDAIRGR